jgi:hypothetical protein
MTTNQIVGTAVGLGVLFVTAWVLSKGWKAGAK